MRWLLTCVNSSVLGLLEQEPDAFLQSGAQGDDGEVAEKR